MDADIAALAASQHGVLARTQALARGLNPRQVDHRLAIGRWTEIHPAVYAISGAPLTWRGMAKAAELWAAPDGVLSHRTAGRLLGIDGLKYVPLEVSSLRGLHSPGPLVHRPRRLPTSQVIVVDGIRTTEPARTILDICAVARPWEAEAALDSALSDGVIDWGDLRRILAAEARRGRNGVGRLRQLMAQRSPNEKAPGSVLATEFLSWMVREGFDRPVAEFRVYLGPGWIFDLDFAYPADKIGFEIDGYRPHRGRMNFDRDRERENLLKVEGWLIIRVTHTLLVHKPDILRATIGRALDLRSA